MNPITQTDCIWFPTSLQRDLGKDDVAALIRSSSIGSIPLERTIEQTKQTLALSLLTIMNNAAFED